MGIIGRVWAGLGIGDILHCTTLGIPLSIYKGDEGDRLEF